MVIGQSLGPDLPKVAAPRVVGADEGQLRGLIGRLLGLDVERDLFEGPLALFGDLVKFCDDCFGLGQYFGFQRGLGCGTDRRSSHGGRRLIGFRRLGRRFATSPEAQAEGQEKGDEGFHWEIEYLKIGESQIRPCLEPTSLIVKDFGFQPFAEPLPSFWKAALL